MDPLQAWITFDYNRCAPPGVQRVVIDLSSYSYFDSSKRSGGQPPGFKPARGAQLPLKHRFAPANNVNDVTQQPWAVG